jgi:ABC-type transport system involved in multi-copper enzyme maturation permease subunit
MTACRPPAPPAAFPASGWVRLGLLYLPVFATAAAGLLVPEDAPMPWVRLLLWGCVVGGPVVALAVVWRCRLGPVLPLARWQLLGPVLSCEWLRCSRRGRYILSRCLYTAALLGVLGWTYLSWFGARGAEPLDLLWGETTIAPADLPRFAGWFFAAFIGAQLTAVLLLAPVYVAGAIAEERERRTLEFLLATDLGPAEIVVSKLSARLLNLALLLLSGLPVLALTQLLGGVDPLRVVVGFAATGLTMLSVGSLALFNSVTARGPVEAVLITYGQVVLCLIVCCLPCLNLGHPFLLLSALANADNPNLILVLGAYVPIHGLTACILLNAAATRLRVAPFAPPATVSESARPIAPGELPRRFLPARPRPPLDGQAVLWKELHVEPHWSWEKLHPLLGVFVLFVGVCAGSLGLTLLLLGLFAEDKLAQPLNLWVRCVGTSLTGLVLFLTAFYAAGAVSRERERQTLDSLLTLPDGRRAVLGAKWRACFLSTRGLWWLLPAAWGLGLVSGALHVLAVPLLALAVAVYLAFVASLGLFCSTVCRSTLRATLATVITLLAVSGGVGLLSWGGSVLRTGAAAGRVARLQWLAEAALALPGALWSLAVRYDEVGSVGEAAFRTVPVMAGLGLYAVAAVVLWQLARARFEAEAGPPPRKQQA